MTLTRRSLLGGIGALLVAPAIVRAASLMPVKAWDQWVSLIPNGQFGWINPRTREISHDVLPDIETWQRIHQRQHQEMLRIAARTPIFHEPVPEYD